MAFMYCMWTPLHVAIWHGRLGSVQLLMARGASFRTANRAEGWGGRCPFTMAASALHSAAAAGDISVIIAVLDHFSLDDVDVLDHQSLTPLRRAYTRGSMDTVKFFCDRGADINHPGFPKQSTLMQACALGRFDDVSGLGTGLLDLGADAAMTSEHELTALLHLSDHIWCHIDTSGFSRSNKFPKARSAMEALLGNGADGNTEDPVLGFVPLITVAQYCQTDMIQLLLDHNADSNAVGSHGGEHGLTALRVACSSHRSIPTSDMKGTVKLLLEHGASVYTEGSRPSGTTLDHLIINFERSNLGRSGESLGGVLGVILDHGLEFDSSMDTDNLFYRFFILDHIDCCRLLIEHGVEAPKVRIQEMVSFATRWNSSEGLQLTLSLEGASELVVQSIEHQHPSVHAEPEEGIIDDVDVTAREKSPSSWNFGHG